MNATIADRTRNVRPGRSLGRGHRLRLVPILGPSHDLPRYRLLDEQTIGAVQVTESVEGGIVNQLSVQNDLNEALFLLDGQELIGAKQNRILNTDVLVPAHAALKIPVSCVEAGRWKYQTARFGRGRAASSQVRAGKQARVHDSLRNSRGHDANQGAVWEDVRKSLVAADHTSPTAALHDAYVARETELGKFRGVVRLPPDAVGLAAFARGEFVGLDLFDRHETLRHHWDALIDSYAVDRLFDDNAGDADVPTAKTPGSRQSVTAAARPGAALRKILTRVTEGAWEAFDSPGGGQDWRLEDDRMAGSALIAEGSVVHLQLFAKA